MSPSATFPGLGNPSRPEDSTPCQGWAALSGNKAFPDGRRRKEGGREGSVSSPGTRMASQAPHPEPVNSWAASCPGAQTLPQNPGGSEGSFIPGE